MPIKYRDEKRIIEGRIFRRVGEYPTKKDAEKAADNSRNEYKGFIFKIIPTKQGFSLYMGSLRR